MMIFSYIQKCTKLYQLNIFKKIKKDYKKELAKYIKSFLKEKKIKKIKTPICREHYKISHKTEKKILLSIEKTL